MKIIPVPIIPASFLLLCHPILITEKKLVVIHEIMIGEIKWSIHGLCMTLNYIYYLANSSGGKSDTLWSCASCSCAIYGINRRAFNIYYFVRNSSTIA